MHKPLGTEGRDAPHEGRGQVGIHQHTREHTHTHAHTVTATQLEEEAEELEVWRLYPDRMKQLVFDYTTMTQTFQKLISQKYGQHKGINKWKALNHPDSLDLLTKSQFYIKQHIKYDQWSHQTSTYTLILKLYSICHSFQITSNFDFHKIPHILYCL